MSQLLWMTMSPHQGGKSDRGFCQRQPQQLVCSPEPQAFLAGVMDDDKLSAYQTLYTSLKTVALLMAPFAPFYSDRLYSDLVDPSLEEEGYASVHTSEFPVSDSSLIDSRS